MHWTTPGYEALELSTQLVVKEALGRGHAVDVLDAESCFIRIRGKGKTEYLQQATRTSADSYVSPLIMENKKVTKLLLREAGIRVPDGREYTDLATLRADFGQLRDRGVVVKPNSTNFGIAVSLLPAPVGEDEYLRAGEAAFQEDRDRPRGGDHPGPGVPLPRDRRRGAGGPSSRAGARHGRRAEHGPRS